MKDAFWFPHDSNARNDARLLELRAELGWEGYGLWWALVEQLREAADYRLTNEKTGGLAMGLSITKSQLETLLALCFDLGLLELEDGYFYAPALRRRMEPWDARRAAFSEAGKRGAGKRWGGEQPATDPAEATPTAPQSPPNSQAIATPLAGSVAIEYKENKFIESKLTQPVVGAACAAAAPLAEKKTETQVEVLAQPVNDASHTGGVAAPARKPASRAPTLTGELADLLNEGGAAARVQTMRQPFLQLEADALVARFGSEAARQILLDMANNAKLTTAYVSANLTAQNWLTRRQKEAASAPPPAARPAYASRPVGQVAQRQNTVNAALALLHAKNNPTG